MCHPIYLECAAYLYEIVQIEIRIFLAIEWSVLDHICDIAFNFERACNVFISLIGRSMMSGTQSSTIVFSSYGVSPVTVVFVPGSSHYLVEFTM